VLLQRYEVETLQNRQEHPKREIAALGPVQVDVRRLLKRLRARSKRLRRSRRATARRLLKRLQSLPEGLRHPLGAGNTETRLVELIGRDVALAQWRHPQVDERLSEARTAQTAVTLRRHGSSI